MEGHVILRAPLRFVQLNGTETRCRIRAFAFVDRDHAHRRLVALEPEFCFSAAMPVC
jgi:hypothetical protein